jgi:hypothetical protein
LSDNPTYSISEFCKAERISRAHLYALWRDGRGPVYYEVGSDGKGGRRITEQSRQQWHERLRASTGSSTFTAPITTPSTPTTPSTTATKEAK